MERNDTALATGKERDLTNEAAKMFYKHLKEDIVSGFNGGQKLEVFLMVSYLPVINYIEILIFHSLPFSFIRLQ